MRTREYFKEVMSTYANENYRASIVLLYTTVVYDLFVKLQELESTYEDKHAVRILEEIKKDKDNEFSSKWEWALIEKLNKDTEIINKSTYIELDHLKKIRNLCAHPALNEDLELYNPDKYLVMSFIQTLYVEVLTKPPIFINNIVHMMASDLDGKYDLYKSNIRELENYLDGKYFSKMSLSMKKSVMMAFWKFSFTESASDDTNRKWKSNRSINRHVVRILLENNWEYLKDFLLEKEQKNELTFLEERNSWQFENMLILISVIPELYNIFNSPRKHIIQQGVEKLDKEYYVFSWFLSENMIEHIDKLISREEFYFSNYSHIYHLGSICSDLGYRDKYHEYIIEIYGNSKNFNQADACFDTLIEPELTSFSPSSIEKIIKYTDENYQINGRGMHWESYDKVISQLDN